MSPENLIANPGRLKILTALAVDSRQEFVHLRKRTQLTDGNLASHARRLQHAGFIAIDKQIRDGKPVTSLALTTEGRSALESHVRRLMAAISQRRVHSDAAVLSSPEPAVAIEADQEDVWVD
jgi:DNA-binding MarR family transcriptional regulator